MTQTLNQRTAFKDYKTRPRKVRPVVRCALWFAHKVQIGLAIGLTMLAAHFAFVNIPSVAEFVAHWIAK